MRSQCGLERKLSGCGDYRGVAHEGASPVSRTGVCLVGLTLWWGPKSSQVSLGLGKGHLGEVAVVGGGGGVYLVRS